MISIKRAADWDTLDVYSKKVPCKRGTGRIDTKYGHERKLAIEFHQDPTNFASEKLLAAEAFKSYKVYKTPDLRAKLEEDFNSKCAYCEGDGSETAGKDIEHFRPKARITSGNLDLVPGYYWLAGDWDNLLLSCQSCNRPASHHFPNEYTKLVGGKRNEFPLSNESLRARSPDDDFVKEEAVRLLLNPCRENPEMELTYDEEGLIFPTECEDAGSPSRGAVSIEVYSLHRLSLCSARKKELRRLQVLIESLETHLIALPTTDDRVICIGKIGKLADDIFEAFSSRAIYLGIKRYWLRQKIAVNAFDLLKRFGIDLSQLVNQLDLS